MKRIFISYAHGASQALAERIAAGLHKASLDPWHDEERLRGGESIEAVLQEAITTSSAIVFLITRDWLTRPWPQQEAAIAAVWGEAHPSVRRVPVLCAPGLESQLPPSIRNLRCETWYDGDEIGDDDARLWRILCAIEKEEPMGSRVEWAESWRQYVARCSLRLGSIKKDDQQRTCATRDRESLDCGRDSEWNDILALWRQRMHAMAVVCGAEGEAHEHFLSRIEHRLPRERPYVAEWVNWWPTPKARLDFITCLAEALCVEPEDLGDRLTQLFETHDLILFHELVEVSRGPDHALLQKYYTEWLPELLRAAGGERSLISVQPVAWRVAEKRSGNWLRAVLSGIARSPSDAETSRRISDETARMLIACAERLPAHMTVPLTPVGETDVSRFCERLQKYTAEERAEILLRAKALRKEDPSERVLDEIDACIEDLWRRRSTLSDANVKGAQQWSPTSSRQ